MASCLVIVEMSFMKVKGRWKKRPEIIFKPSWNKYLSSDIGLVEMVSRLCGLYFETSNRGWCCVVHYQTAASTCHNFSFRFRSFMENNNPDGGKTRHLMQASVKRTSITPPKIVKWVELHKMVPGTSGKAGWIMPNRNVKILRTQLKHVIKLSYERQTCAFSWNIGCFIGIRILIMACYNPLYS